MPESARLPCVRALDAHLVAPALVIVSRENHLHLLGAVVAGALQDAERLANALHARVRIEAAPASLQAQDPMLGALVAATKTRIEDVRKRALAGEDFEALVKETSDAATNANGGLIGPIGTRDLNPSIRAMIDGLKPGEISEPIQGPRGYQILKLESRDAAVQLPFDKVRDRIELAIRNERLDGEMVKLKARLRAGAVIEWKDDNLRRIYERRLAEITGAPERTTS